MEIVKNEKRNELFKASFILLILLNIANVLNYLFHFVMGRMLGPVDYGTLAVLTSIIYIFSIPTSAIQTLVARHTARFNVNKEYGKIKGMLGLTLTEAGGLAIFLFIIFIILSYFFSDIIKIPLGLLCLTGLYIFGAVLSPIAVGILQGSKKFGVWGWNSILNSSVKIIVSIILVLAGFRVYGPMLGFFIGVIISFLFIFPYIPEILRARTISEKISIISKENISLLIAIFMITLMYSLDIIFAKIFFSAEIAGKYAVASMIGKMIFFGTSSISGAMFPISSERFFKDSKEKTNKIINKTFFIISSLCLISIIALLIFPKLIISILFGKTYIDIYSIMFYLGVAFSFLSLTNTLILYKLSVYEFRIRHALLLGLLLIIQIIVFFIFKNNLTSFSIAFMFSTILTFITSIILIWRPTKQK
jgi:O-antigen/teichoic acid export membrane protein